MNECCEAIHMESCFCFANEQRAPGPQEISRSPGKTFSWNFCGGQPIPNISGNRYPKLTCAAEFEKQTYKK